MVGDETVIRFQFTDTTEFADWRITVKQGEVDLCEKDPGKEVDIYFTTTVKKMIEVWMGDTSYQKAIANDSLNVIGPKALINDINSWLESSIFSEIAPATEI
ncbi:MAG: alkyl sulfatase C-terminal domain-containing protein [Candidatus Thiodiazotropha sp.]